MTAYETPRPELKSLPHDKLQFDPANPRFGDAGQGQTQDQIQILLEREPHFAKNLVDSFLENGFIKYEPLVVRRHGDQYVVVEGNRRLAAIRYILANREKYKDRGSKIDDLLAIPVLVFPEIPNVEDKKEQRVYLGVHHLFGFREWPPESKAKFLDSQVRTKEDLQRVLQELNIQRREIQRYLVPYRLWKKAKQLWEPYKEQDFWLMGESLARTGIKDYLMLDVDPDTLEVREFDKGKLRNLLGFIYGVPEGGKLASKRIRETRDLSRLARVLESKRATAVLERGRPLEEAALLIESPQAEKQRQLKRLLRDLKVVLRALLGRPRAARSKQPVLVAFESFERRVKQFLRDAKKSNI